jgi:hypothetical protein
MGPLPEWRDVNQCPVPQTAWLDWSIRELNYEVDAFRHGVYLDHGSPYRDSGYPAPGLAGNPGLAPASQE